MGLSEVILHIGTPKTGTTSLQRFLYINRHRLARKGFAFPVFKSREPRCDETQNGNLVVLHWRSLHLSNFSAPKHLEKEVAFLKELGHKEDSKVILTEENLSIFPEIWQDTRVLLKRCGFERMTVVMYVRRQDDFLFSLWKQGIQGGYIDASFEGLSSRPLYIMRSSYNHLAKSIQENMEPDDRMIIRRFDRSGFEGGDLYHDFCAAIQLPWDEGFKIPKSLNISTTCDVTAAMAEINQGGFPQINNNGSINRYPREVLMEVAEDYSREHPDPKGTFPAIPEFRRKLLERFREGNEELARTYLEGAQLFDYSVSDDYPVWEPDEVRTAKVKAELMDAYEKRMRSPVCAATMLFLKARRTLDRQLGSIGGDHS